METHGNFLEEFSNVLQILSFLILIEDFNNTDLMKYLKHQDALLDKIIKQNDEIEKTLNDILKIWKNKI